MKKEQYEYVNKLDYIGARISIKQLQNIDINITDLAEKLLIVMKC